MKTENKEEIKTGNKKRVAIWMENDLLDKADRLMVSKGFKNRSDFICAAVCFYIGYLHSGDSVLYTEKTLLEAMDERLELHQKNICRTLFKLAVELGINSHVIAESYEGITPEYFDELRRLAIR